MHAVERNTIRWVSQDAEGVALFELDLPAEDALELALGRRIAGYYGEPRRIPAQEAIRNVRAEVAGASAELDQIVAQDFHRWLIEERGLVSLDGNLDPDELADWLDEHGPEGFTRR